MPIGVAQTVGDQSGLGNNDTAPRADGKALVPVARLFFVATPRGWR
jgi:hypothetical protein